MIPIYLFNASPWGSLTKGYRLLNPLSQREMREKNPYNIQRWRTLLSSCIIHASWSPPTANKRILANMCTHIQRNEDAFLHAILFPLLHCWVASMSVQMICLTRYVEFYLHLSVMIVLLHKSSPPGGKRKQKKERHCEQLGIFLLPRKGWAINNWSHKQPELCRGLRDRNVTWAAEWRQGEAHPCSK